MTIPVKKQTLVLFVSIIALAASVQAQPGGISGPKFTGFIGALFAGNPTFSADVECHVTSDQRTMTIPGKIAFDAGKSRFEMNLEDVKGAQLPPNLAQHFKTMGMNQIIAISRPDSKVYDLVYPGLGAYAETPVPDPDDVKPASTFKTATTELGKETLDGHPCVKNKVVITDDQGKTQEATVWNAADLKKFPIKIETTDQGRPTTIIFKNIKTSKPDPALFSPSSDYRKYDSQRAMLQQEMMKRMGITTMPAKHP